MVERKECTKCAGGGKIYPHDKPPEDPYSEEAAAAWIECPRCRGSGVEMADADQAYEVYFYFTDEVEAREFMERAAADEAARQYGMRRVERDDDPLRPHRPWD